MSDYAFSSAAEHLKKAQPALAVLGRPTGLSSPHVHLQHDIMRFWSHAFLEGKAVKETPNHVVFSLSLSVAIQHATNQAFCPYRVPGAIKDPHMKI